MAELRFRWCLWVQVIRVEPMRVGRLPLVYISVSTAETSLPKDSIELVSVGRVLI